MCEQMTFLRRDTAENSGRKGLCINSLSSLYHHLCSTERCQLQSHGHGAHFHTQSYKECSSFITNENQVIQAEVGVDLREAGTLGKHRTLSMSLGKLASGNSKVTPNVHMGNCTEILNWFWKRNLAFHCFPTSSVRFSERRC